MGKPSHISLSLTATVEEQEVSFQVYEVDTIVNDGSADILINFDKDTTQSHTIRLMPFESLQNFNRACRRLFFRSEAGSQPFRAIGVA